MHDFKYARPATITAAATLIKKGGADPVFLAGGQTLIPALKMRLRQPSTVIDLAGVKGLVGISEKKAAGKNKSITLIVGALTTHAAVAGSKLVKARIPALASLAEGIGDAQVRHAGTLGGSIANADPAADYPAAIVALKAEVVTNKRRIPGDAFFTGFFETALKKGEIVMAVRFAVPDKAAYIKFAQPASRFALVGVFVAKFGGEVRVAVTGAGASVFRVPAMEKALAKSFTAAALAGIAVSTADLNSDIHAAADYRAHLIGVAAKRAVEACG